MRFVKVGTFLHNTIHIKNTLPMKEYECYGRHILEMNEAIHFSIASASYTYNRRDCIAMWKTISLFPAYSVLCDVANRVS